MSSIKDEIRIQASASKAYAALSTQAGYRGWWNAAGEIPETVGGAVQLRFIKDGQPVNMGFHIDEMTPEKSVKWTCTSNDMSNWLGTTLHWQIKPAGDAVLVSLDHGGWSGAASEMAAQGWKHFFGSLKAYLETGKGQPW